MNALLTALAIGAVVVLVALVLRNRKPEPPTQQRWTVPEQLDRRDFDSPDAPWLVVVFTSSTCDACAKVRSTAEVLRSEAVAVDVVDYQEKKQVHTRYGIDAVPTTVISDRNGIVAKHFVGPVTAADLWAAVAELREPGSTPPPEAHVPRSS